jgi:hypothetical protein
MFFQENPLCAFTEFLMESVAKKNFKGSIRSLKEFKAHWFNMKINVSHSALYRDFTFFQICKFEGWVELCSVSQAGLYLDLYI